MELTISTFKLKFLFLALLTFVFSACNPLFSTGMTQGEVMPSTQNVNSKASEESLVFQSPLKTQTKTPTLTPSFTPSSTVTSTVTSTPFALNNFEFNFKPNEIYPQQYQDTCVYLANRWGQEKSEPGTIVVPIMYHSVRQSGRPLQDDMQVTQEYFEYTMQYAEQLGFETITTEELIGFLYHNDPIPQYSMILIIDDRRLGVVNEHFMKYLDKNDWTVTLAYITGVATELEWMEFDRLNVNNRLDLQAHGFLHNGETYITEHTPKEVIEQELYSPIPIIEEKAGRRPEAFIWPGGNFTEESVLLAREAGYQVGFTVFSRGPLMYNWIPLGATEIKVNDPLLVLPRFWSSSATLNLESAVKISSLAKQFAEDNEEQEKIWFQNYCATYDETNGDD